MSLESRVAGLRWEVGSIAEKKGHDIEGLVEHPRSLGGETK